MKLFSNCSGECCLCACGDGCLAGIGDDDFSPASKEQIIERLDKNQFKDYTHVMKYHLKHKFKYDYDKEKENTIRNVVIDTINNGPGMQIPVTPPKMDFERGTITTKIMVDSVSKANEAILAKICEIAKAKEINYVFVLNEEYIGNALAKHIPQKVKPYLDYKTIKICPTCGHELIYGSKFCDQCGQKLDWEEEDEGHNS